MKRNEIVNAINMKAKKRSAWDKGVKQYAFEILDALDDEKIEKLHKATIYPALLLNGSTTNLDYSYDCKSLIFSEDIAHRLCTKAEFKKHCRGVVFTNPNKHETWFDVQARAILDAFLLINSCL